MQSLGLQGVVPSSLIKLHKHPWGWGKQENDVHFTWRDFRIRIV